MQHNNRQQPIDLAPPTARFSVYECRVAHTGKPGGFIICRKRDPMRPITHLPVTENVKLETLRRAAIRLAGMRVDRGDESQAVGQLLMRYAVGDPSSFRSGWIEWLRIRRGQPVVAPRCPRRMPAGWPGKYFRRSDQRPYSKAA
jgi:hypothetical protein